MTIKRKVSKAPVVIQSEFEIDEETLKMINRGGKTPNDNVIDHAPVEEVQKEKEFRFTLRGPVSLLKKIDEARKPRIGNVSRNQWILEVISNAVK